MTKEKIMEILNVVLKTGRVYQYRKEEVNEAFDIIIKALEQQPSEDCIDRAQALHACCDEWNKDYKAIMKSIRQLPSVTPQQTRWIPVSEKPQKGRYLCTYEHCDGKCIDFGSFDGESWYIKPIAYMPLPEPYTESEDKE